MDILFRLAVLASIFTFSALVVFGIPALLQHLGVDIGSASDEVDL